MTQARGHDRSPEHSPEHIGGLTTQATEPLDDLVYENRPSPGITIDSWGHPPYRFSRPIEVKAGDHVRLLAQHNRHVLLIVNLPPAPEPRMRSRTAQAIN
jgi:hypothetical protein